MNEKDRSSSPPPANTTTDWEKRRQMSLTVCKALSIYKPLCVAPSPLKRRGLGLGWFCSLSAVLLGFRSIALLSSSVSGSRLCRVRMLTSTCFIADSSCEERGRHTRKSVGED
ncbi:uncharacterized [Tachysurus ichikawai]